MKNNATTKTQKTCYFCDNNVHDVDYKDIRLLEKFINYHRKILPRQRTGTCAKHQRKLATAIKRARAIALLGFVNR
ncbi:MAG: 30S ribosomal protein S18 [Candidatus Omnitrophica bacterium]|nr:30S ribosomal protein S18 [Candidatus Omnitrophota bacterium]